MRKDYQLEKRKYVIGGFLVIIAIIYLWRLFGLQIQDDKYKDYADNNAFLRKTVYPSRGLIYDRNDSLVVFNQPAYDVMMIPRDVHDFDTLDFCRTLSLTPEEFRERLAAMKASRSYSSYTPQTLLTHLSAKDYGKLQEKLYRYPGFFIQKRILREYNYDIAANILGNIREVSEADIERDPYFQPGDYCGDLGIEKSYDTMLRGIKGTEILIRDARGRIRGRFEDGARDVAPVSGRNLRLSIDIKLQEYAESLMVNKIGAVVAIEPATGEILAMVSSPTYRPSTLVGRERGKNYRALNNDPQKPLFDRALMGAYPPGSTFKPSQGLILLQEEIVNLQTAYPCYHGFISGGLRVGCHGHYSPIPLKPALQTSCNAYFCWGFKALVDKRSKYGSSANASKCGKTTSYRWATDISWASISHPRDAVSSPTPNSTIKSTARGTGVPTPSYRYRSVRVKSSPLRCRLPTYVRPLPTADGSSRPMWLKRFRTPSSMNNTAPDASPPSTPNTSTKWPKGCAWR